jgi:hypothetical protein
MAAYAEVATVLGSILASSNIVESEWRQMKQCWKKYWSSSSAALYAIALQETLQGTRIIKDIPFLLLVD